jgi:dipeptidyl aminopeptidase/acylaminoacyl peptidase
LAQQVFDKYGTFEQSPEFWKGVSAINYLWNIKSPVMLHQGDEDQDVPVQWSRDLNTALEGNGAHITYYEYPREGHLFLNNFQTMIKRSADFFDENLK